MSENYLILPAKMSIERIIEVPKGGAVNHPWSPGAKYEAKSSKTPSGKARNLRGRRLFSSSVSDSHSRSKFGQQTPNPAYKGYRSVPSLEDNRPKSGSIRVGSVAKTDENNKTTTIYYDKAGQIIDGPAESEFLNDVDLASDGSPTETKSQTEDVHNPNSGLTKARNNLTPVQDDKLTPEGDLVNPSQLTSNGRSVIDKTKDRRAAPLLQSKYEDKDKGFLLAYSTNQLTNKEKHTLEVLEKLKKNITKYNELSKNEQLQIDLTIVEGLLAHPDTELHMNVMGQGKEPVAMILNRGLGNYPLKDHISTFERRPEICNYNSYITNYLAKERQIERFDLSNSTLITYEDLVGNSHTNIGPVFGEIDSSTPAPTVNNATVNGDKSEL